jgi:type VI secretion system protein ImpK
MSAARLLWDADPILVLVTQLRTTTAVADLARLRARMLSMLQEFQERARSHRVESARVAQATEVLGALIDQVVTSMPWGAEVGWKSVAASKSARTERPAARMLEVARASTSDVALRELVCVALALGFDRRGRGAEDAQIEEVLAQLTKLHAAAAAKSGTPADSYLSAEATELIARSKPWTSWLPLWVSSLVAAALLATLFFVLVLSLGALSDRVYAHIAALHGPTLSQRGQPAAEPRLAAALAREVTAREVFVRDEVDRSEIIIPNEKLFSQDDAALVPQATSLLQAVAAALQRMPGRIQVIGHTEGTIAHSARYPSDWDLSVDRARSVQTALRGLGIDGARLTFDGRANIEPLRAADGARAVSGNGRVTIVLLVGR